MIHSFNHCEVKSVLLPLLQSPMSDDEVRAIAVKMAEYCAKRCPKSDPDEKAINLYRKHATLENGMRSSAQWALQQVEYAAIAVHSENDAIDAIYWANYASEQMIQYVFESTYWSNEAKFKAIEKQYAFLIKLLQKIQFSSMPTVSTYR